VQPGDQRTWEKLKEEGFNNTENGEGSSTGQGEKEPI